MKLNYIKNGMDPKISSIRYGMKVITMEKTYTAKN